MTRALLRQRFNIALEGTTIYLLDQATYDELLHAEFEVDHPEWTQGLASGESVYINRAPRRVWDTTVSREERVRWLAGHVEEATSGSLGPGLAMLAKEE